MIEFFIYACKSLGIELIESEKGFNISVPPKFKSEMGGEQFYLQREELIESNYIIQRVAKLVSNTRPTISYAVASGTRGKRNEYVYVWVKITIYKSMKEEILKGYKYNFENETVESIEYGNLSIFDTIEKRSPFLALELVKKAYENVMELAAANAKQYIKMKQLEENIERDKEIERIENYYSLLAKEHANAETANSKEELSKKEEKEALLKEKDHLVGQQRIKHHIREEETVIEPVAVVVLEIK